MRTDSDIIIALEYPALWDGIIKLRLPSPRQSSANEISTGPDLQTAIIESLKLNFSSSWNFSNVTVEAYDSVSHSFVPLLQEKHSKRFGTRLKANIVSIEEPQRNNGTVYPAIAGRIFDANVKDGVVLDKKRLKIRELSNSKVSEGTGLNVWDGSILMSKYLERHPVLVRGKSVVELGAGCGLVGISAAVLGAEEVVLTDLPYALELTRVNIELNRKHYPAGCKRIEGLVCDWYNPILTPKDLGISSRSTVAAILAADCVWLDELVNPFLNTLHGLSLLFSNAVILICYQRRGSTSHKSFFRGINELFHVKIMDSNLDRLVPCGSFLLIELRCKIL